MKLIIDTKRFNDCTLGRLTTDFNSFQCWTLELPDENNQQNISCIPAGVYRAFKRYSPSKQYDVIQLQDVPNRSYIQIHPGNFTRQILGCILPGMSIKHIDDDGVPDIAGSEMAFEKLMQMTPDEFDIEIKR